MLIQYIPQQFQPGYTSNYPEYSSGKNMEEIFYDFFSTNKNTIESDYIYLPIFWTSYYVMHNYAKNINELYDWLDTLDKTKKYFTIVQYDDGIFVRNFDLDILVFSGGGGGLNIQNDNTIRITRFYNLERYIFFGNKGDYDIPLICLPLFPTIDVQKDVYCSFMGRFENHNCRMVLKKILENNNNFKLFNSVNFEEYKSIINRSIFTLAPRGYGYTSFRIYEAIMGNSIPIYIWEDKKVLPFSDIINWDDFAVVINSNEIENLPNILKNINVNDKLNNMLKVKDMFTFNYTYEYIKTKIEKQSFISVAIPHFNNTNFIRDAIDPLINDTRITEIIICDDKSNDIEELEKIIQNYNNKKICLFKNDINLGCYHNKINAINKCTNDWAILLDSDNIYDKNSIDAIYKITKWDENTIYAPSNAITFKNTINDTIPSPNLNYSNYSNQFITKTFYLNEFNNIKFQCLINNCNYFLNVKKFIKCMNQTQQDYKREIIDCLDSAVLFTDWLSDDKNIFIVDSLQYHHRLHIKSNYRLSKSHRHNKRVLSSLFHKIKTQK